MIAINNEILNSSMGSANNQLGQLNFGISQLEMNANTVSSPNALSFENLLHKCLDPVTNNTNKLQMQVTSIATKAESGIMDPQDLLKVQEAVIKDTTTLTLISKGVGMMIKGINELTHLQ